MFEKIFDPMRFQGNLHRKNYFEGWYYKQVHTRSGKTIAFIPGISLNERDSHSFVQVIMSPPVETHYFRFSIDEFSASDSPFEIRIGKNSFRRDGIELDLKMDSSIIRAELSYGPLSLIERSLLMPNIMGFFAFFPRMACNHGVISMDHSVRGCVEYGEERLVFEDERGYIEKDWGTSFPERYIWIQANHFESLGDSFMMSIADVPTLELSFTGLIANLHHLGKEYRFATYNGAKIRSVKTFKGDICCFLSRGELTLEVKATVAEKGSLKAPIKGRMEDTIKEGLGGTVELKLKRGNETIADMKSRYAGIEVVGDFD